MIKISLHHSWYRDPTKLSFTSGENFSIMYPVVWYDGNNVYKSEKKEIITYEGYSSDGMRRTGGTRETFYSMSDQVIAPEDIPEPVMETILAAWELRDE